ncbi:alpha,alpha-trehalose-phosphate synthase [Candidatus Steffania adelgidicola]|uniref:alpha,alpha-trehalose-phosphate synthase n=1 Tax=Candidatus Steffania adelgidicola TaxID=1076626 RepID=UPI001D01F618|nr:alpha,alpha-trehalose-phosphate synthase [Candidatus Steffania adelgidicola]UDG79546.1 Trehalose-6-phosphate synthase [Candidatus Steffania adelgidicola]
MNHLVVVSNRIASFESKKESAGGLAVAIRDSLKDQGGLWFGWNGKISEEDEPLEKNQKDNITFASFTLKQHEYNQYYLNFSNTVIWPAFHYRLDLVQYQREDYDGYCRVNDMLAGRLNPLVDKDDILWIHDYHLLPFAASCRKLGMTNRIGFFLHIPFPTSEIFNALPPRKDLLKKLCEYDLLGFQTESDRQAFIENLALVTTVKELDNDGITIDDKTSIARVYPIGVEPDSIRELAEGLLPPKLAHLRNKMNGQLIISVDRLDYSKGLPERFQAYEILLENYPQHRGNIRYFQIAPTSRGDVQAYQDIRHELETEAGRINGHFSTLEWTPLFYLNQHYERSLLMKIFRHCEVGLVTPLRDGMNLVAKEYVASQNPNDPGVLILSRFAGAANELKSALLVNPYDRDGVAAALDKALTMPLKERKQRHQEMIAVIKKNDILHWRQSFLKDLKNSSNSKPAG